MAPIRHDPRTAAAEHVALQRKLDAALLAGCDTHGIRTEIAASQSAAAAYAAASRAEAQRIADALEESLAAKASARVAETTAALSARMARLHAPEFIHPETST